MIRIGIVGSRRRSTYRDHDIVRDIIRTAVEKHGNDGVIVVSGGCPTGADEFARISSEVLDTWYVEFRPKVEPYCQRWEFTVAAFARNRTIAENCDVLFALVASDRKGGTENTISHAKKCGVTYYVVDSKGNCLKDC